MLARQKHFIASHLAVRKNKSRASEQMTTAEARLAQRTLEARTVWMYPHDGLWLQLHSELMSPVQRHGRDEVRADARRVVAARDRDSVDSGMA